MQKTKKIVIVGNRGNAKLAHYYFTNDSEYEVLAFSVDEPYIAEDTFCDLPVVVLKGIEKKYPPSECHLFVAIGYTQMNKIRENLYTRCKKMNYVLPNFISSKCSFLSKEVIGDNNFILEDNTIQPFVKIGSNNVLWSGNHIGHDTTLGDHNFITSHVVVSGFCKVLNNTFIGVNATIRDGVSIANGTLVAAGAIIMKDTKQKEVHVPSKSSVLNKKSDEIIIS